MEYGPAMRSSGAVINNIINFYDGINSYGVSGAIMDYR